MAEWRNLGLDFVTLRVFKAAVEERSFVNAAEREHLAPSAISRRISEFENRLGIVLLRRHDRGVEPTPAGELLMAHLESLFDIVEMTLSDLEALTAGQSGSVRILANLSSISSRVPALVGALARDHPRIDIQLVQCNSEEALRSLSLGAAEIALVTGDLDLSAVTGFDLYSETLMAMLPSGHPLGCGRTTLTLSEIATLPYVGLSDGLALQTLVRQKAIGNGSELKEAISVDGFDVVAKFVAEGLGASIVPEFHAREARNSHAVDVFPLDEAWAVRNTKICVRSVTKLSPTAKLVLNYMIDAAAKLHVATPLNALVAG